MIVNRINKNTDRVKIARNKLGRRSLNAVLQTEQEAAFMTG
jgi:hypothetical protein